MKHQALFSSKDKNKNNNNVVCCNFAWRLRVESCTIAEKISRLQKFQKKKINK